MARERVASDAFSRHLGLNVPENLVEIALVGQSSR
jgi:hypothetical protein